MTAARLRAIAFSMETIIDDTSQNLDLRRKAERLFNEALDGAKTFEREMLNT